MSSYIFELLANTEDGVLGVDLNQKVVFWNGAAERILGYTAEEVLGKRCYQILGGRSEDGEQICTANCAAILLARAGRIGHPTRVLIRTKNYMPRWVRISHILVPLADPKLTTLVHIIHDVPEEVEAQQLVRHLKDMLSGGPDVVTGMSAPTDCEGEYPVTPRELDVLRLVAQGMPTKTIAEMLKIAPATVRNHVQNALSKLDAHNRLEAVAIAVRHRLL